MFSVSITPAGEKDAQNGGETTSPAPPSSPRSSLSSSSESVDLGHYDDEHGVSDAYITHPTPQFAEQGIPGNSTDTSITVGPLHASSEKYCCCFRLLRITDLPESMNEYMFLGAQALARAFAGSYAFAWIWFGMWYRSVTADYKTATAAFVYQLPNFVLLMALMLFAIWTAFVTSLRVLFEKTYVITVVIGTILVPVYIGALIVAFVKSPLLPAITNAGCVALHIVWIVCAILSLRKDLPRCCCGPRRSHVPNEGTAMIAV